MTLRLVLGLSWSLAAGLAGGWLVVAPWALGEQEGGIPWTTVTRNEVGSGLGLIALALAGMVIVAVQSVGALRRAGVLVPRRPGAVDGVTSSAEMERTLVAVAQALAQELEAQREPASERAVGASSDPGRRGQP